MRGQAVVACEQANLIVGLGFADIDLRTAGTLQSREPAVFIF
jgi:hypothetical protein